VPLSLRQQLTPPGAPLEHVYFIEHGLASVVIKSNNGKEIEVGMVGHEGMVGVDVIMGDLHSVFDTFMQIEGAAYRLSSEILQGGLEQSCSLRTHLNRYARAFSIQVAATALANGRMKLEAKLARWLVMVQDRTQNESFKLTHEFLSVMLGVRRPGVTMALQVLEGKNLIRSRRAEVVIIDRAGLITHAGGSYGLPEEQYERLLGSPRLRTLADGSGNHHPQ
jgi:CRP-like cAMP-binding protein